MQYSFADRLLARPAPSTHWNPGVVAFICGRPTPEQKAAYKQCYRWLYDTIDIVKPGITAADIAARWPTADAWGFKTEAEARGLAVGQGIGLPIHEKPFIGRLFSFDKPFPIEEGMVIAMET